MKKILIENYKGFDIYFEALEEDYEIFDFWDEDLKKETIKKIEDLEIVLFCAKVSVVLPFYSNFELSSDYLGGCIYESEESFYTTYKNDYYSDMRETVINEAQKEVKRLKNLLNNY